MKKILLLIIILLFTACSSENINVENPLAITYNDTIISKNDFEKITDLISTVKFYQGKVSIADDNLLTISTENDLYKIYISNNYDMEYVTNNNYYHTKDREKVEKIIKTLDNIKNDYYDTSYFTIRSEIDYQISDADIFIKLDKNKDYIVLHSLLPLYDFKINEIDYNLKDKTYNEIDLLYSIDFLDKNVNIVIRKEILKNPNFKISFKNKYNYLTNILPIINNYNDTNFIIELAK